MAKYDLETIRHSAAHLMAQAIMRVFPDKKIQLGIGPTIDTGFYYDIEMDQRITEEDFEKIEAMMNTIIQEKLPITRKEISKEEALDHFNKTGQLLKIELIEGLPAGEVISCYSQGEFTDLCRGPHVENTSHIPPFFKILHTAGAYWRGSSDRQMLQRVYATVFKSKQELKDYLNFLEEAKKRDHRKLGKDLELFLFDKVAPGSPFFMPKGTVIYNELVNYMRRVYRHFDYKEVITPQVLDVELWHTSGHYDNYKDDMFFTSAEKREFALKPMNCPCHMLMFKHFKYSYRDLPLRYADFGRLHRNEKSGTLAGLTRVRTFCQDDAHIFVPLNMIQEEIKELIRMFTTVYRHFKFEDVKINLSTRPEKKVGDDKTWDIAEDALKKALELGGHEYAIKEGDGAFYGPKIDFQVADALKRRHQLGTIQLDFQLPDRFDLKFVNPQGENERPVVLHRALLGSLERFFGVYLEHIAGIFPFWLAPEQAVIIPIKEDLHGAYSKELKEKLTKMGYRVRLDNRNESMNYKTREAQTSKIPYTLFIGDREMASDSVGVRCYGENKTQTLSTSELLNLFESKLKENTPEELS